VVTLYHVLLDVTILIFFITYNGVDYWEFIHCQGYSLDKEWHKCQPIDTLLQFVSKRDQLCYIHVV
jgi:hypothetical protein